MNRILAPLLLVLSLAIPAVASADVDPRVDPAAVAIAQAQWPSSPCTGVETIHVGDVAADHPDAAMPNAPANVFQAAYATWSNGACDVELDPRMLTPYNTCRALAHEFGHLASRNGQHITDDPSNIMSAIIPDQYAPCDPLKPAPAPSIAPVQVVAPVATPVRTVKKVKRVRRHTKWYLQTN